METPRAKEKERKNHRSHLYYEAYFLCKVANWQLLKNFYLYFTRPTK